jgi:Membrane transport protein
MVEALLFSDCHFDAEDSSFVMFVRSSVQWRGAALSDTAHMILDSIVPVFFVMAVSYLAGWTRDIDNHHVAELNALVMDFALPASLFVAMVQTPRAQLLQQSSLMVVLGVSMLVFSRP